MKVVKAVNPRSVTDAERPWLDNWSDDAHRLLLNEVTERESRRLALNMCSYIATRVIGEDPGVGSPQKAKYRKILAELAELGITPPPLNGRGSVTPPAYTGERGLRPASVASAPQPAARSASVASAPAPAETSAKRRRGAGGAAASGPDELEKSLFGAEGMTRRPPRMYGETGYVDQEPEDEYALAA